MRAPFNAEPSCSKQRHRDPYQTRPLRVVPELPERVVAPAPHASVHHGAGVAVSHRDGGDAGRKALMVPDAASVIIGAPPCHPPTVPTASSIRNTASACSR